MLEYSDHGRVTAAGWAYRTNDRGWVIYRDPQTSAWHPRSESILIIWSRVLNEVSLPAEQRLQK